MEVQKSLLANQHRISLLAERTEGGMSESHDIAPYDPIQAALSEARAMLLQLHSLVPELVVPGVDDAYATATDLLVQLDAQVGEPHELAGTIRLLNAAAVEVNGIHGRTVVKPLVISPPLEAALAGQVPAPKPAPSSSRWLTTAIVAIALAGIAAICVVFVLPGGSSAPAAPPASAVNAGGSNANAASDACGNLEPATVMVSQMKIGQAGYTVGWAYFSQNGKVWLNPQYDVAACTFGTLHVRIVRKANGYYIYPDADDPVTPGSMSNYEGEADVKPIPVTVGR